MGFFGVVGEGEETHLLRTAHFRLGCRVSGFRRMETLLGGRCVSPVAHRFRMSQYPLLQASVLLLFSVQKNGYKKRKNNAAGEEIRLFSSQSISAQKNRKKINPTPQALHAVSKRSAAGASLVTRPSRRATDGFFAPRACRRRDERCGGKKLRPSRIHHDDSLFSS